MPIRYGDLFKIKINLLSLCHCFLTAIFFFYSFPFCIHFISSKEKQSACVFLELLYMTDNQRNKYWDHKKGWNQECLMILAIGTNNNEHHRWWTNQEQSITVPYAGYRSSLQTNNIEENQRKISVQEVHWPRNYRTKTYITWITKPIEILFFAPLASFCLPIMAKWYCFYKPICTQPWGERSSFIFVYQR